MSNLNNFMNIKEFMLLADTVSKEKNISKEQVIGAISEGIETALRKNFPIGSMLQADIEEDEIKVWRLFKLVHQIENVESEMLFNEVENETVSDGYVWEPVHVNMTRQQFNIVKQVAINKIKNISYQEEIDNILSKPNQLLTGIVKVVKRDSILVENSGMDFTIPKSHLLPKDNYKVNDKIFFVLIKDKHGYIGSKTDNKYVQSLLEKNIVQIEEGIIEIIKIARIPGYRTKILVKSHRANVEPVKACVGFKGQNIKSISNLMNGEFLDIINYTEDTPTLLINCMAPVHLTSIVVNEDTEQIDIAVKDDEISLAIGKGKQNLELINKIMDMKVNIFSETKWNEKNQLDQDSLNELFQYGLSCDYDLADILIQSGFTSLEEVAYVAVDEFPLDEIEHDTVLELQKNAKNILKQIPKLNLDNYEFMKSLGLSVEDCSLLLNNLVSSKQDIADLSSFEMQEFIPSLEIEKINEIIMKCRS